MYGRGSLALSNVGAQKFVPFGGVVCHRRMLVLPRKDEGVPQTVGVKCLRPSPQDWGTQGVEKSCKTPSCARLTKTNQGINIPLTRLCRMHT